MNIIQKTLDELIPYEKNPRNNDIAVQPVANSIKEFGFLVPLVIDKDNVIISGHTRYKASKQLGLKKVPCVIADELTDEQVKAFRLADNKVGELAGWDLGLLVDELKEIEALDMQDFGFLNTEDLLEDFFEEEQEKSKDDTPEEELDGKKVIVICDDANYQGLIDYLDKHLYVYEV
ncbi:ParB N-terminal domain-containing protein [Veillonella caviae]|uniref:ParB N-terminal domain-containing protein n=1 Tax=Veillonella caviae TaxID=248316 RepID=UPI0023EFAA35|nr:ParB N-terminal domain-containing protein [Veillonella caviae]MCI6406991.1 ParB N-terminal domain-containing protein [Veillonella caviae]MDY5408394.1 ParB N-terminal domain-containing protein [Veillonella caviae]MDY6224387.1 ParB N-terminal domain-containing protein [Veillonella caviae]